jgi:hypothetical protein
MGYKPPKGVRPPQLEGKRTGRPKGSESLADAWRDMRWAYDHIDDDCVSPPTRGAKLWWMFASRYPDEVERFLEAFGKI